MVNDVEIRIDDDDGDDNDDDDRIEGKSVMLMVMMMVMVVAMLAMLYDSTTMTGEEEALKIGRLCLSRSELEEAERRRRGECSSHLSKASGSAARPPYIFLHLKQSIQRSRARTGAAG